MRPPSHDWRVPVPYFLLVLETFVLLGFVLFAAVQKVDSCEGEEDAAEGDADAGD